MLLLVTRCDPGSMIWGTSPTGVPGFTTYCIEPTWIAVSLADLVTALFEGPGSLQATAMVPPP